MLIHFKRPFYCVKDLSQKADFSFKKIPRNAFNERAYNTRCNIVQSIYKHQYELMVILKSIVL